MYSDRVVKPAALQKRILKNSYQLFRNVEDEKPHEKLCLLDKYEQGHREYSKNQQRLCFGGKGTSHKTELLDKNRLNVV